ncbi:MAG: hypothetical protein H6813_05980 [Phycisphaeraceae bacterium]|nr:hypothetical protein [Phycisphaeraceae bacterium]MCB9848018.1 hypothetical protein [Phycisphaeraceae bacterium]
MQQHIRGFGWRCPLAAIVSIALGTGPGALASEPSYTFHYGVSGDEAGSIDLGGAPIERDVFMFFEHTLGLYPRIDQQNGRWINGGLPQRADLDAHLGACLNEILEAIPDPEWDGFVVIDYESWTPWWEDTPRRYRNATIEDLRERMPYLTDEELETIGRQEYEAAARQLMEGTIDLGRALRPEARWGYWSYPKARHALLGDNEQTQWLWDASDAFYPSVYMTDYLVPDWMEPGLGQARYETYIESDFDGNLAVARQVAGPDRPVLAFAWPRYGRNNENQWYRLHLIEHEHLNLMLFGPYFWDADGVILWDNLPQPGIANAFQEYVDEEIGPMTRQINDYVVEQDQQNEEERIPQDVNSDGSVNTSDLAYVISKLGTDDELADINGDGIVDTSDVISVINAFTG